MKKQLIFFVLLGVFLSIFLGFFTLRSMNLEKTINESGTVYIKKTENGFQLYRNNKPFYIQGASGNSHFKELANIGGNTIRVYDTLNLSDILDEAYEDSLAVIVDIPLPKFSKEYCFYLDEDNNETLKRKVKSLVDEHCNHPALLMWNLGNELNYPSVRTKRIIYNFFNLSAYKEENNFIETFNELINIIHREDPNHPVSTAFYENQKKMNTTASIYLNSPEIDLVAYNTFGNIKNLEILNSQISTSDFRGPYYLSEWGFDGHWERETTLWNAPIEPTSTKKAEQIKERYKIITEMNDETCLGTLLFFWGEKHERTNTWFSLFKDDSKSEIIKELEKLWGDSVSNYTPIGLNYMLVDSKGARDNIIFAPNETKTAELVFHDIKNDSVRIEWEIHHEDWYLNNQSKTSPPEKLVGSFVRYEKNKATFITPVDEGPYRIFAYVYDQYGYFATTNTPFYVLSNK